MPFHLRTILTLACALYLGGAHWAVLQVSAWSGMLVTRSLHGDVPEAVRTTFDGAHPCGLCSAVAVGQMEEKRQLPEAPILKKMPEVKFAAFETLVVPRCEESGVGSWPDLVGSSEMRSESPSVPPPRCG